MSKKSRKKGTPRARIPRAEVPVAWQVPIVGDAGIASRGSGGGRLIPLLIIDTSKRPDVDELIRVHQHISPGDVGSVWGQPLRRPGEISLVLDFERPIETNIVLTFNIEQQGGLVDQIVRAKAVYLQPGRAGDRIGLTWNSPRILVEVLASGFEEEWNRLLHQSLAGSFRREGLGRQEAALAAGRWVNDWRQAFDQRLP